MKENKEYKANKIYEYVATGIFVTFSMTEIIIYLSMFMPDNPPLAIFMSIMMPLLNMVLIGGFLKVLAADNKDILEEFGTTKSEEN